MAAFASSYIPTLAASVTRSADVASVNTLSPWFSNVEGTLYLEASRYATAANNEAPVSLDDTGGASSRMSTYTASSTNVLGEFIADGGATQANLATSAVTNNVPFKFGIAYKANDFAASKDGATVVTDTSGTVPTILRMTSRDVRYRGGKPIQRSYSTYCLLSQEAPECRATSTHRLSACQAA